LTTKTCTNRVSAVVYKAMYAASGKDGSASKAYDAAMRDHYHNVMVTLLLLLATRIHLSVSTPYTGVIAFLVGSRLFIKVYEAQESLLDVAVLVADSVLLQCMCVAGILPQFATLNEGCAGIVTLVFSCISVARVVHSIRGSQPPRPP
jgi:hypothetical protein